jgi:hypothetical protein
VGLFEKLDLYSSDDTELTRCGGRQWALSLKTSLTGQRCLLVDAAERCSLLHGSSLLGAATAQETFMAYGLHRPWVPWAAPHAGLISQGLTQVAADPVSTPPLPAS